MRLSISKAFTFFVLASSFFACSKNDSVTPQVPITFLAMGASFTYYYNSFYQDTVKVVIAEQIGKDTFLIKSTSPTAPVVPVEYWTVKGNSFYSSFRMRDPGSYIIECKFGEPVGTSWSVKKGLYDFTYTIDGVNVSVTTGQGTVTDAVKVKITYAGGAPLYQYVSPSVGLIGTGNFEETSTSLRLIKYKSGTTATTTNVIPAITYGNFPFLKVGNYWKYDETDFLGNVTPLTLTVESKLSNSNIYKVLLAYDGGSSSYSYWYEDNGHLMAYEDGEQVVQADPLYVTGAKAEVGYGWGGYTATGTYFIYTISELNKTVSTYFGNLSTTAIQVSSGISSQINYWNQNKGNVLVTGLFVSRDITDSNARMSKSRPFVPIIGF